MHTQLLLPFIGYFCVLLTIGLIAHRRQTSSADFIVGNRSLNFWVTALSAHASDMSSWLFMAFPALIYLGGLSQSWVALGLLVGMFCNWQFIARRLRSLTEKYDSYTLSTFFERRFNDTTGIIRILTAVMSLFFLTSYIAAGLIGLGLVFESVFGINFYIGITISSIVILIYTFVGGFITVAWTDLCQALFLLCAIIVVPVIAYSTLDNGLASVIEAANHKQISLSILPDLSMDTILTIIFLILSWAPGYFGQPHILTKFMGINNVSNMNKSKYIGMCWQLVALGAATSIGFVAIAFFSTPLANPELVFIEMVKILFHPLAAGFILCGVLAATISTIDSQILVCGSILSEDIYRNLFRKRASQRELLAASRSGVMIVTFVALGLALNKNTTILEAVAYAWAGLGCSFGPVLLSALYWKRVNNYGAIAGVFVGGLVAGVWPSVNGYFTSLVIPAMIPGFLLSFASIYFVTRLTEVQSVKGVKVKA